MIIAVCVHSGVLPILPYMMIRPVVVLVCVRVLHDWRGRGPLQLSGHAGVALWYPEPQQIFFMDLRVALFVAKS